MAQKNFCNAFLCAAALMTVEMASAADEAAQSSQPTDTAATARLDRLEEIVVTATKVERSVRDIPISVTAIPGQSLESIAASQLQDYLKQDPSISQNTSGGSQSNRVSIRGVGIETQPGGSTQQTTGYFINDTPFNDPYISAITPDLDAFDIERVEILKGPQGTLFGASALGGAIRYIPAAPTTDGFEMKAFAQYQGVDQGSRSKNEEPSFGAALNVPLMNDSMALRGTYVNRQDPNPYRDRYTGDQNEADEVEMYRIGYLWDISDNLQVKASYLEQSVEVSSIPTYGDGQDLRDIYSHGDTRSTKEQRDPGRPTEFSVGTLELSYDWRDTLRIVSSTNRLDKSFGLVTELTRAFVNPPDVPNGVFIDLQQDVTGYTQELRLQSLSDGPLQWLVGVFGFDYEQQFDLVTYSSALNPLTPFTLELGRSDIEVESNELAAFGEATYTVGTDLDLTAGLRVYRSETSGVFHNNGLLLVQQIGLFDQTTRPEVSDSGVNPKLAVVYRMTQHSSLYGNVAKGFRLGGVNPLPDRPTYQSDELWSFEVGSRNELLDGATQLDLALYYIDWKDPQILQRTPQTGIQYVDNVGGAKIRGAEARLLTRLPVDGLSFFASMSYKSAETTKVFVDDTQTTIPSGTALPGTPDFSAYASLSWARVIFSQVEMKLSADYTYMGPAYSNLKKQQEILDYGLWGLSLSLAMPDLRGSPSLVIAATNLSNEDALANAGYITGSVPVSPIIDHFYVRPRTITARLTFDF